MKPILFNAEMVRAILDGRKSVTRRDPFQTQPDYDVLKGLYRDGKGRLCALFQCRKDPTTEAVYARYDRGDILWVRETWAAWSPTYGVAPKLYYKADGDAPAGIKWRPSIHMPKEAARLFLRVTGVRVERLRDIECIATEGIMMVPADNKRDPRYYFAKLWDTTIKPADLPLYGWEDNPWVWVIKFERISKDEALGGGGDAN